MLSFTTSWTMESTAGPVRDPPYLTWDIAHNPGMAFSGNVRCKIKSQVVFTFNMGICQPFTHIDEAVQWPQSSSGLERFGEEKDLKRVQCWKFCDWVEAQVPFDSHCLVLWNPNASQRCTADWEMYRVKDMESRWLQGYGEQMWRRPVPD